MSFIEREMIFVVFAVLLHPRRKRKKSELSRVMELCSGQVDIRLSEKTRLRNERLGMYVSQQRRVNLVGFNRRAAASE